MDSYIETEDFNQRQERLANDAPKTHPLSIAAPDTSVAAYAMRDKAPGTS